MSFLLLSSSFLQAQSIVVEGSSNVLGSVPLEDIQKIVVTEDKIVFTKSDSEVDFLLADINKLFFSESTSSGEIKLPDAEKMHSRILIFPNPVKEYANIQVASDQAGAIEIIIYNSLGKQVFRIKERSGPGKNLWQWPAADNPPGIYFCTVRMNHVYETKKIMLAR